MRISYGKTSAPRSSAYFYIQLIRVVGLISPDKEEGLWPRAGSRRQLELILVGAVGGGSLCCKYLGWQEKAKVDIFYTYYQHWHWDQEGNLHPFPEPNLGRAPSFSHGFGVLDTAMPMSQAHILSGTYSFGASSTPHKYLLPHVVVFSVTCI